MHAWPSIYRPAFSYHQELPHLRLFDSFKNELVEVPLQQPVTMYVCGITPYDATHLGHAATYLTFDLLHRYLLAAGNRVTFLENVTDIDDPLFERARRDHIDWNQLVKEQLRLFVSDMTNLRVLPPIKLVSVTESMKEIIAFVSTLVEKNLTYALGRDLYLDASQVTDFSDLPITMELALSIFQERGGDPNRPGKRHPLDPLLWRASSEDEPSWGTTFGSGRPGWHVECNAIAREIVATSARPSLTIQGGGADLIFPHHYMTEIQSRARFGTSFSEVYVHAGMIRYQGEKMSKSLGNLVFVSKLIEAGVHPMAIRFALISGHYRSEREWSDDLLTAAEELLGDILEILSRELVPDYQELMRAIVEALADDLDTPRVVALLRNYVKNADKAGADGGTSRNPGDLSRFLDAIIGITI